MSEWLQANLVRLIRDCLSDYSIPVRRNVDQWAAENRWLSPEASADKGVLWRSFPWQDEPMRAITDPNVGGVVLRWGSQLGKSEIVLNVAGYFIDAEPAPIMMVQPTIGEAERFSKNRVAGMIRESPVLRDKVRDPRSRDSGNTILEKTFPGGHLKLVGANAPTGLASTPIRVVLLDEIDRYPSSAGSEGDPVALAIRRADSFPDAVFLLTSTPTVRRMSRIDSEMEQTDQRHFFVRCHTCGLYQHLRWSQVQWPANHPEDAAYVCEGCQTMWTDERRRAAILAGEWRPTAQSASGWRGYCLNGIYSLFQHRPAYRNRLHQMAVEATEAKAKGIATLRVWTNTFLAESWVDELEVGVQAESVMERVEPYGDGALPAGILILVAGIDVQEDRIEMEVVGFGMGEESWGIEVGIFHGNPERRESWVPVRQMLERRWPHPSGKQLRISTCCIDSAFKTDAVYEFVRPLAGRGVFAVRGSNVPGSPIVSRPGTSSVKEVHLFRVGTETAKELIYSRLKVAKPGPLFCHFPQGHGYTDEFFKQLSAEAWEIVYRRGFPRRIWHKTRERNEALDRRVYVHAALAIADPDWDRLAKMLAPTDAPVTSSIQTPVTRPARRRLRVGLPGW